MASILKIALGVALGIGIIVALGLGVLWSFLAVNLD